MHSDVRPAEFFGQRDRHAAERVLRGRVGALQRVSLDADNGRNVHDVFQGGCAEQRQRLAAQQKRGPVIDRPAAIEILGAGRGQRCRVRHAGIFHFFGCVLGRRCT